MNSATLVYPDFACDLDFDPTTFTYELGHRYSEDVHVPAYQNEVSRSRRTDETERITTAELTRGITITTAADGLSLSVGT